MSQLREFSCKWIAMLKRGGQREVEFTVTAQDLGGAYVAASRYIANNNLPDTIPQGHSSTSGVIINDNGTTGGKV